VTIARTRIAVTVCAGLFAGLASPPAPARAETPSDRLSCAAPFDRAASHAAILAVFGKADVAWQKVDGAEGEKIPATVIFGDHPDRRLELFWADEKARRGLATLRLSEESVWIAPNGLKIGMSLAAVEKLNGRPFALSGFDWDFGGSVVDWKGGTLGGKLPGGCLVQVRFTAGADAPEAAATAVSGDRVFASSDRNMRAVAPVIGALSFGYPQP
jgi:hypothetical protein